MCSIALSKELDISQHPARYPVGFAMAWPPATDWLHRRPMQKQPFPGKSRRHPGVSHRSVGIAPIWSLVSLTGVSGHIPSIFSSISAHVFSTPAPALKNLQLLVFTD